MAREGRGLKYREITFPENQVIATNLLREHGYDEKSRIPIDPELVIREKGIDLIPFPGLRRDHGLKGCVAKQEGSLQILIDKWHYEEDETSIFTLGEELGHCVLHLIDLDKVKSVSDWIRIVYQNKSVSRYIEQQARVFSSNILLPHFSFCDYVLSWTAANLTSISTFSNLTVESLSENIASLLEDEIPLSHWILDYTLRRWPDRTIDQIVAKYPSLIRQKRKP